MVFLSLQLLLRILVLLVKNIKIEQQRVDQIDIGFVLLENDLSILEINVFDLDE